MRNIYKLLKTLHNPIESNQGDRCIIFENREDAVRRLAEKLRSLLYQIQKKDVINRSNTSILAIPRGGVVTGDVLVSTKGVIGSFSSKTG